MEIIELLINEMEQEANTTRKMLERIPDDKLDWKPHEKSMTLKQLATHIAELPDWPAMVLSTDGIDFATMDYKPKEVKDAKDLAALHEKSLEKGRTAISSANKDQLKNIWTMRTGDLIHSKQNKYEVIRMSFSQIVHHRAQLGVYLRLLHVPIPGSYGPSADETDM